jgi:5'-3' exonuclease
MKVAIIDCDSVAFSIFNGNKVLDSEGNPVKVLSEAGNMVFQYTDKTEEELKQSADEVLHSILRKGGFTHYLGFIKGKNTIDFKRKIFPNYKVNRSKEQPKQWEFVKKDLITRFNIFEANGAEVDDYVNVARLNIPNSHICAIDSDLLALEGTHYNWRKNEWLTTLDEDSEYNFWINVITGTHNNTKGIPGKGKVFAKKLIDEDEYGTPLFNLILHEFVKKFGEYEGINQFYQNYICCKTLESIPGVDINDYKPIIYE